MKVALVNPPAESTITRRWRCAVEQGHYLYHPIELAYIAGTLKQIRSAYVTIIDCVAECLDAEGLQRKLSEFSPELVIFMSGFENLEDDVEVMIKAKKALKFDLVMFGYYSTMFSKEIMEKYPELDFLVRGEPEITLRKMYRKIKKGDKDFSRVFGVTFRKNGKIKITKDREPVSDVDEIPMPAWDLVKFNLYYEAFPDPAPFGTILTSRGCPFNCTYCIKSYGNKLRQRSVDNVMQEIDFLVRKQKIKSLRILDDTFTVSKKWVEEFCERLKASRYDLKWTCLSRPETLDDSMLSKMKEAGCVRILVGIESGSKKILNYYNRHYDLDKIKNLFTSMRKVGIQSFGFFMIGAPIETEEDIEKSLEVAKNTNPDFITLNMMRIYPGTELFDQLKQKKKASFSLFPHHSEFEANIQGKELSDMMFKFYKRFYFRPWYVITHIPMFLKNPRFTFKLLKEFLKWMKKGTNF